MKHNFEEVLNPQVAEDNSDRIEEMSYSLPLTDEEMLEAKEDLAEVSIKEAKLEEEKKNVVDEFKVKIDPLKKNKKEILQEINSGVREYYGKVFVINDYKNRVVGYYSEKGRLFKIRPMSSQDNQMSILSNTGTEQF